MASVVDPVLLVLDLGGATDADHGNTAHELGKVLLEPLALVVRRGLLDCTLIWLTRPSMSFR